MYLNGPIDEEIYTEKALHIIIKIGYASSDSVRSLKKMLEEISVGNKLCLLKRALYGFLGSESHATVHLFNSSLGSKKISGKPRVPLQD